MVGALVSRRGLDTAARRARVPLDQRAGPAPGGRVGPRDEDQYRDPVRRGISVGSAGGGGVGEPAGSRYGRSQSSRATRPAGGPGGRVGPRDEGQYRDPVRSGISVGSAGGGGVGQPTGSRYTGSLALAEYSTSELIAGRVGPRNEDQYRDPVRWGVSVGPAGGGGVGQPTGSRYTGSLALAEYSTSELVAGRVGEAGRGRVRIETPSGPGSRWQRVGPRRRGRPSRGGSGRAGSRRRC